MNWEQTQLDILITHGTIVTMDQDTIIENGLLGIANGQIVVLEEDRGDRAHIAATTLDASQKVIFPGLINTHTHFFQSLLKGLGADLPLLEWINAVPVPYGQKITPELMTLATKLSIMEALQSGCTTVAEFFYTHHRPELGDVIIETLQEMGMRGVLIRSFQTCGQEFGIPESFVEPLDTALQDVERLLSAYQNEMLRVWTGPTVPWSSYKERFETIVEFCRSHHIGYSTHLVETEMDNIVFKEKHGKDIVEFFAESGFLSPELLAVHCVKLSQDDITRLQEHQVNISYNAVSNMYLGSGSPRISEMMKKGMTIALGTDGAASNNAQDMLETLKFSALLQKVTHEDPAIISARDVVKMATIDGARALHWEDNIGSLEVGKYADLFILNPYTPKAMPMHDPLATLVYSCGQQNVETTIVNGKILYHKGEFSDGFEHERFLNELQEFCLKQGVFS